MQEIERIGREAISERTAERNEEAIARASEIGIFDPPPLTVARADRIEARLIDFRQKKKGKKAAESVARNLEEANQKSEVNESAPAPAPVPSVVIVGSTINTDIDLEIDPDFLESEFSIDDDGIHDDKPGH